MLCEWMTDVEYSFPLQDIMNREKEDELPLMQVGFIDSICMPIYEVSDRDWVFSLSDTIKTLFVYLCPPLQAFAVLSPKLIPLVDGVRNNKDEWLKLGSSGGNNNQRNGNGSSQSVAATISNGNARTSSTVRARKVSRKNSKNSMYEGVACNGNYLKEENNNNNNCSVGGEAAAECKNCPAVEQQNGDPMKCTVCRSNSNGYSSSSSSSRILPSSVAGSGSHSRLESNYVVNCPGRGENNNVNVNSSSGTGTSHPVDGVAAEGEGSTATLEATSLLINSDSCARTPKIVGKLGKLDSTQLLLSANINHNHHEQQREEGETAVELSSSVGSGKSVEWRGCGEDQRQEGEVLLSGTSESNNNNNNDDDGEEDGEGEEKHGEGHRELGLRRRKSGFCEVVEDQRRRRSSGRLAEDAVSVATLGS